MKLSKEAQKYVQDLTFPIDWSEELSLNLVDDIMYALCFDIARDQTFNRKTRESALRNVLNEFKDYRRFVLGISV